MRIISGGQSGADRGGLDAAIELDLNHGGWCPANRRSEDGRIPEIYNLTETTSSNYLVRTRMNVADADATIIFTRGPLTGGSAKTYQFAEQEEKPALYINLERLTSSVQDVKSFIEIYKPAVLNIAGSRESKCPGIQQMVKEILTQALKEIDGTTSKDHTEKQEG